MIASATRSGIPIASSHGCGRSATMRLGQVTGHQRGDRDAQLRTRQLERQPCAGRAGSSGRGGRRLRALASTVLRSSAVSENSAATNSALPKMSTAMASTLTTVTVTFMAGSAIAAAPGRRASRGSCSESPLRPEADGLDGCLRHVIPFARCHAALCCGPERSRNSHGSEDIRPTGYDVLSPRRRRHQPSGSGWPSAKPAADCTPTTARSCSSARVEAPT